MLITVRQIHTIFGKGLWRGFQILFNPTAGAEEAMTVSPKPTQLVGCRFITNQCNQGKPDKSAKGKFRGSDYNTIFPKAD